MFKLQFLLMLAFTAFLSASNSHAEEESVDKVTQEITNFLTERLKYDDTTRIEIAKSNPKQILKNKKCDKPLKYSFSPNQRFQSRIFVDVVCLTPNVDWKMKFPVKVNIFKKIAVATRNIAKSERLSEENTQLIEQNITRMHNQYYESFDEIAGKYAKKPILKGQVLSANSISLPKLIHRGEIVQITARKRGLAVQMQGAALADGVSGTRIPVKNLTTQKVVEGYVKAPGQVEIVL